MRWGQGVCKGYCTACEYICRWIYCSLFCNHVVVLPYMKQNSLTQSCLSFFVSFLFLFLIHTVFLKIHNKKTVFCFCHFDNAYQCSCLWHCLAQKASRQQGWGNQFDKTIWWCLCFLYVCLPDQDTHTNADVWHKDPNSRYWQYLLLVILWLSFSVYFKC